MRHILSRSTLFFALIASLFLLPACDSGGSGGSSSDPSDADDAIEGSFTIDVTPTSGSSDPDTTYKGASFYVDGEGVENAPDTTFVIYFTSDDADSQTEVQDGLFGFLGRSGPSPARPGTGTYDIVDSETSGTDKFAGAVWENFGNTTGGFFYAFKKGDLDITKSNDDRVEGNIDVTADALSFTSTTVDTTEVKMTGSFEANDVDFFLGTPTGP